MLRRQARLRKDYLYRKTVEDKFKNIQAKKDRLKRSLEENIPIHGDLRKNALALQEKLEWEDEGEYPKFVKNFKCFLLSFSHGNSNKLL